MNWLEVQLLLESMQKTMDCPICLEMMKNPVSTTCNHNFCNFCISKFISRNRSVPCPMCKTPLSRRCFRENSKLKDIIDKIKKLVLAIETDTGWTYTTPTKNKTLPNSGKRPKSNCTSAKRKISLADNDEHLDEGKSRNTRFGKRRKSTNDKDKDSLCYDSLSSELTSLDVFNLSKELSPEPCSREKQETVTCVSPLILTKDKSSTKDNSFCKISKPKTQPSGNLRLTHVWPADKVVRNNSDNLSVMGDESQKSEFLDSHSKQTVPSEFDSLTLIPSTSAMDHNKENSSRAENLTEHYNFRRNTRYSTDSIVNRNEPSGSLQRLQTRKEVLKNIKNLTEEFESPRELDDQTVLESTSHNHPKKKNIMLSPVKTRSQMKCQPSPGKATRESCVASEQALTRYSTYNDSCRFACDDLRKKKESISEINTKTLYRSRGTLNMISINSKRNEHGRSSQSTLDGGHGNNHLIKADNLKKTNSSHAFRNVEKDPFNRIANSPDRKNDQSGSYSVLVWSSDSEEDQAIVKESDKDLSFKWSAEPGKMKTYSRKHSSQKNRAKITKWLRLLPNNFDNAENPTQNKEEELSVPWMVFSLQDAESSNLNSKRKSKANQKTEQISRIDCSIDSGPDLSVSQLENCTSIYGNKDKTESQKIRSTLETDIDSSPRCSESVHKANEMDLSLNTLKENNLDSSQIRNENKTKYQKIRPSIDMNNEISGPSWSENACKTNEMDLSLNTLKEKNPEFSQDDVKTDLKITSDKKDFENIDIQECTPRTSDRFYLGNVSVSRSLSEEKKNKYRFAKSKDSKTLPENINPFEFIDSPKAIKQQRCNKRKKARKSLSKMPELSFQNRLTRSFQKRLGCKNIAPDVLPSVQGDRDSQCIQELKDKISSEKKHLTKMPDNLGTQLARKNCSTNILQEKYAKPLTPVSLELGKEELETGNLPYNAKLNLCSIPTLDNPASCEFSESSLKSKTSDKILLDAWKGSKEQDDFSLDIRNTDNHRTKELIKKFPDSKFVEPFASENNQRKSGRRRRSRRPSKEDHEISIEQEILELANQISSAEEHSFLFNSQDVCRSFDVPVDDQVVSDHDATWKKNNNTCIDEQGESEIIMHRVRVNSPDANTDKVTGKIQSKDIRVEFDNEIEDINISKRSTAYNCRQNEEMCISSSIAPVENNGYENRNFPSTGTTENFSANQLKPVQKTSLRSQQNKDNVAKDNFLKPVEKSVLHKNKHGIDSLKKDPQVLASSLSPTCLEKWKLTNAKTITSVSSMKNLVERKNPQAAQSSLKDSQSVKEENKYAKDEFLKPAEKSILHKADLSNTSLKKLPQTVASSASFTNLEKNEWVDTKSLSAESNRHLLQRKSFNSKTSLEAPPSLTRSTILCQAIETVPSTSHLEEPSLNSKIHPNKEKRNVIDLDINSSKSDSTNSSFETTITIDGTKMHPDTPLLFQEQLRNSPRSELCLDLLSTPVMDPNGTDVTNSLNVQKSVLQNSKNAQVCDISIPITPTVIPESPFSEMPSSPLGKKSMGTPALQQDEQKNRAVRFSNQMSFISKPRNSHKEVLKNGNSQTSFSAEIVGSLQDFDSRNLEKISHHLRKCHDVKLKMDDLENKHLAINSNLNRFQDVGNMDSTLCKSHAEKGTMTDCLSYPQKFQDNKEDLSIKVCEKKDYDEKKVVELGKGGVRISPSVALELEPKPNLRYCRSTLSSLKNNADPSFDNSTLINMQSTESSSQRWMNEDLLPLDVDSSNQNHDRFQTAAISEESDKNPEMNDDWNSFTLCKQPLSLKTSREYLFLQDQDEKTQGFVTHEHVAHLTDDYHHLSDNFPGKDQSEISIEKGSDQKNDLIKVDDDSEGHSSGTEDLNVNPDPSEFEPPNLDIQPDTVKKLLSDVGTTNLIKNVSPRLRVHAIEHVKNSGFPSNLQDFNMEPSNETSPVLTQSKTFAASKKKSVKKRAQLSGGSSQEKTETLILDGESMRINQMANSVSTVSSSDNSSQKRNLESQDGKFCGSLNSPCQILYYSSDDIAKDSPKTKELSSMPEKLEQHILKASDNVEVLPNVRLVDYDISQSSLLSETDSDVPFMPLVGRKTRSGSCSQNQLQNSAKIGKSKSTHSNSSNTPKPDSTVYEECNKIDNYDPVAEGGSLMHVDSWLTITDNLDSVTIFKSQDISQSKTKEDVAEELVLTKSGITKNEINSTIAKSEDFTLSSAERKFLRSGFCETEELSDKVDEKDKSSIVIQKEMDDKNRAVADAVDSPQRTTEVLTDCLLGNLNDLNSEKAGKSVSQNINSFVPPLVQSSENLIDEDSRCENTFQMTQLSLSNPLKSASYSDFVLENQNIGTAYKKLSVPPTEMVEFYSSKIDVPDTEIEDLPPVMSLSEPVIPDSLEPILEEQQRLQNESIPKLLTSNQNASQNSLSGFVPCSVEQDGTLVHVLEPFREVYTWNEKTVSKNICDGTNSQINDILENCKISQKSKPLIMDDAVVKTPVPHQVGAESSVVDGTVHKFDSIQETPPEDPGDIIEKSSPSSLAAPSVSNTSKIAFSTECHLMIDSQNFIPVKRSKRKCFSLGGSVQRSPQKPSEENKMVESCTPLSLTLNAADAKSLDVKSATKDLSQSPKITETSHEASRSSLSQSEEVEKAEKKNFSGASSVQEKVLKESNSFESCVLISASEIEELAQASTKDSCSVSELKQILPFLKEKQDKQPQSTPEEQKLDLVSKRTRSVTKSSETPNLADNALTGLSQKSFKSSDIIELVNNQQSLSSWTSANDACKLRSSPRLQARNKPIAKMQNEKKSLRRAKQELVSSKPQRKIPFKTSDSFKVDPEPLHLSPTDSDTQQPSCPLSSAEELEAESTVTSDPADNDNTAPTQAPSLDFSEPERIMDFPQEIPVKPTLEPEPDRHNSQEFLKDNENNLDCEELDQKDDAKDTSELDKKGGCKFQEDSQRTALSSASTKYPSGFSDSSISSSSSQIVLSNLGDKDNSMNIRVKSRIRSGQKVSCHNARMDILGREVKSSDDDAKKVMEVKEPRFNEQSVDDGFTSIEKNKPLAVESEKGKSQDKINPLDDINFLPDIHESFPQGFYPEINFNENQNITLVQPDHPEVVSYIAETSQTKKLSQDKQSECDSTEGSSQKIMDGEQEMAKNQINNCDTKLADWHRSSTVNKDVIVIDELCTGLDCDGMPRTRMKSKDPVIAPAKARESNGKNVVSAEGPVDKNLHCKGDTTAVEKSKDEDLESSEEFTLRCTKKSKCHVIDDSDDEDKKVDNVNLESVSASSPSALSTQSEKFSTQQCTHLEQDLEEMKKQIAQLEARLGLNDSAVDIAVNEEDLELQELKEEQELPTLDVQNLPPDNNCKKNRKVKKEKTCDPKYMRISSSSSDDDNDDMCRKVIPDSDPDEKTIEQNVSTVFPVRKSTVTDLFSSGEESEDLFCTPVSSLSVPQLPVLNLSRQRLSGKDAEEKSSTDPPGDKNAGNRKRSGKDGTSKPSRLKIASSSSEDDMEVVITECPKNKVLPSKVKAKEKKELLSKVKAKAKENKELPSKVKAKENKQARIAEKKIRGSSRNLEEPSCSSSATIRDSPRSAKNCPRTIPKLKTAQQTEPCSPILGELSSTNTAETTTTSHHHQPKKKKCFIATGLSNIEVNEIKKLASMIGGLFLMKFSREVTHVIVKTASENVRYCDRTLKYFQGIANKCWIMSYKWIQESLEKNQLLKEDPYEIIGDSVNGFAHRGPTRARLSHVPLFKNFEIHVVGESSELPQDELKSLFEMAGGNVIAELEGFSSNSSITCLAIAGGNHSLREFRRLKNQLKIYDILLVSREWILDSVAMFRVQPLEGYIQLS